MCWVATWQICLQKSYKVCASSLDPDPDHSKIFAQINLFRSKNSDLVCEWVSFSKQLIAILKLIKILIRNYNCEAVNYFNFKFYILQR